MNKRAPFARFTLEDVAEFALPDSLQRMEDVLRDTLEKAALSASKKTNADELTEVEKFSLAYYAGVPFDFPKSPDSFKYTLRSKPCGIFHNGEKWVVTMREEDCK